MLLAWKRLWAYVEMKLKEGAKTSGNSNESLIRFNILKTNLGDVWEKVENSRLMDDLQKLINVEHRKKENAQEILLPSKRILEKEAVSSWFKSKTHKDENEKVNAIWSKAISSNSIKSSEFVKVANWARFILTLTSKNRAGVMEFTNKEFGDRIPLWLKDNGATFDGQISQDVTMPSKPDDEPNGWMLKLDGSGSSIKNHQSQTVFISVFAMEALNKYRDLKSIR